MMLRFLRSRRPIHAAIIGTGIASAIVTASPAHALIVQPSVGNCGPWGSQRCSGSGQSVPIGTSSLTISFTCTAVTPFSVNSTGVACFLRGDDGKDYHHTGPLFTSGQESTVQRVAVPVKFQGYRICVGAGYLTPGGAFYPAQGYNCAVSPF